MHRGRTRRKRKLGFVAFDSAKEKHAVAIADDGRDGEVRYLGEIDNSSDAVSKLVRRFTRLLSLHPSQTAGNKLPDDLHLHASACEKLIA
jgi:hypothetical protein